METITKKILIQKSPSEIITIADEEKPKCNEEKITCVKNIIKIDIQETNNKEVKEKKIFDHISLFSNKKEPQKIFDESSMKILRTDEFEKLKLNLINLKNNNDFNFDHYGEKIKINWRSRKGYDYEDFFYSCCGTRFSSEKKECPRKNWKTPNSYHPGELYLLSSRRLGGGISPFRNIRYHTPVCNFPTWNCCNNYSYCEGCHLISVKKIN